jgi:hypothetical protein
MSESRDGDLGVLNYLVGFIHILLTILAWFAFMKILILPGPGPKPQPWELALVGCYVLLVAGPCLGFLAGTALFLGWRWVGRTLTGVVVVLAALHSLFIFGNLAVAQVGAQEATVGQRVLVCGVALLLASPSLVYCVVALTLLRGRQVSCPPLGPGDRLATNEASSP